MDAHPRRVKRKDAPRRPSAIDQVEATVADAEDTDDTAGRPGPDAADTVGRRGPTRRQERARLQAALAAKRCTFCLAVGCWEITSKQGKVRYVRCTACGRTDKVVL